jgi:AcrR family transcriptional regulator
MASGIYLTGQERVRQILETALEILIEDGLQALTLREVARRCKVQIGAISYYYKGRSELLQDVLNVVMDKYMDGFKAIREAPDLNPEQKLERLIRLLLDDIQTKMTTRLFPQLWSLADHDPFVAQAVDSIYIMERVTLNDLITEVNPSLDEQQRETLALFLCASIEGSTMFVGFEKPWAKEMPLYSAITVLALTQLVKTITPEQLEVETGPRKTPKSRWQPPTVLPREEYQAVVSELRASLAQYGAVATDADREPQAAKTQAGEPKPGGSRTRSSSATASRRA